MVTQTAEATLHDYLLNGIAKEIFFADEAKSLAVEIGNHADRINAQGYGQLFGSMQVAYSDRQTLCVTKMFDPKNRRHPTRSIPAILNLIEDNATAWSLPQRHKLEETLCTAGHDARQVANLNNAELALAIVSHFRSTLPQIDRATICGLSLSLSTLREARNKIIAHNQAIAQSARTFATWGETEALVNYAKTFVALISFGFLNLYMGNDSDSYLPTADARATTAILKKLFKGANLTE
jgi:hypothetical protein